MEYFFGAVSKNVIDTIITFSLKHPDIPITFIPTRRQIDFLGGYVNNWATETFCKYVKSQNPNIKIERDHGGELQGSMEDDGFSSFAEDVKWLDIIHIDVFKSPNITMELAAEKTAEILKFCDERNQNLVYEIGTEEAIYKITPCELDIFIQTIRTIVPDELFQKIKYLVIQCGTKLLNGRNIGDYDETQLKEMLNVAEKYGKIAKEHNGDWVSEDIKTQKYNAGLRCINVAPEMAEIENCVILEHIKTNDDDYNTVYDLCIKSEKWKKWVDFDNIQEKRDEIILLCCHYVFSSVEFMKIKEKYGNIDNIIQERIAQKLEYFYKNQQIIRNSVCFVIANKYVKSINSSYLKFYVDNINKYYPDGFALIVDNNSENMEDIYNLLSYNTNVKIITNDTEYKFETGAYRCGIQWLMENNLINNYNYFIFTQDTFMLKNIYDFNEKSSLAFSLISFKYDYFKQSVVENILQEIGLNDNYEKINLCVANSFGVHYSKIEQLFNYIKNIKTQTKQDSQIMERVLGRILYELNSHKNDDIDGNIHNIDYCNNNSMDVFNNNDKIDIYNPNIKTIFIKKIHGKC